MSDVPKVQDDLYLYLTKNLSELQAKYPNEPEKSQFMTQYVNARRNYNDSINKKFKDDDPAVASLMAQMKQQQATIKKEVAANASAAKILSAITTAVQVGAKLASLGV